MRAQSFILQGTKRLIASKGSLNRSSALLERRTFTRTFQTRIQMSNNPSVEFDTTEGSFTCEIYLDKMPLTSSNFLDLCETGFYDGLHFHRVIDGFMLQFGCPNSRKNGSADAGTGGPEPNSQFKNLQTNEIERRDSREGCIKDELTQKITNEVGTLSMANTGQKNSGGSQFFINTVHNNFLDWFDRSSPSAHPVFGKVQTGMDVVNKISKVKVNSNDCPVKGVKVNKVTVAY
jgi:cyclophilin family peptidyl-prolyl cis-trans isomerase